MYVCTQMNISRSNSVSSSIANNLQGSSTEHTKGHEHNELSGCAPEEDKQQTVSPSGGPEPTDSQLGGPRRFLSQGTLWEWGPVVYRANFIGASIEKVHTGAPGSI